MSEDGAGKLPVALDGAEIDLENGRDIRHLQAGIALELNDLGDPWIGGFQRGEDFFGVQAAYLAHRSRWKIRLRRKRQGGNMSPSGVVDQDAPHGEGSDVTEVESVPAGKVCGLREPHVRLVDKGSGLK